MDAPGSRCLESDATAKTTSTGDWGETRRVIRPWSRLPLRVCIEVAVSCSTMRNAPGSRRVCDQEVSEYLENGSTPSLTFPNWPGNDLVSRAKGAEDVLRNALIAEVRTRAGKRKPASIPTGFDSVDFARSKLMPMVNGLFSAAEQGTVLELLENSIVFLTPENIEDVILRQEAWLHTAWNLANIYLGSFGLPLLGGEYACIVGLSEETRCYVTSRYFTEDDPYADFVAHEAAHVFHNWKREYAGLPCTRQREWLLPIEFTKRETFALACEAYSKIADGPNGRAERRRRFAEYREKYVPTVAEDRHELVDILDEAVEARNGWKRILTRCSFLKRP